MYIGSGMRVRGRRPFESPPTYLSGFAATIPAMTATGLLRGRFASKAKAFTAAARNGWEPSLSSVHGTARPFEYWLHLLTLHAAPYSMLVEILHVIAMRRR